MHMLKTTEDNTIYDMRCSRSVIIIMRYSLSRAAHQMESNTNVADSLRVRTTVYYFGDFITLLVSSQCMLYIPWRSLFPYVEEY